MPCGPLQRRAGSNRCRARDGRIWTKPQFLPAPMTEFSTLLLRVLKPAYTKLRARMMRARNVVRTTRGADREQGSAGAEEARHPRGLSAAALPPRQGARPENVRVDDIAGPPACHAHLQQLLLQPGTGDHGCAGNRARSGGVGSRPAGLARDEPLDQPSRRGGRAVLRRRRTARDALALITSAPALQAESRHHRRDRNPLAAAIAARTGTAASADDVR